MKIRKYYMIQLRADWDSCKPKTILELLAVIWGWDIFFWDIPFCKSLILINFLALWLMQ